MGGDAMTAFNVVRFHVKPGQDQAFIDAHEAIDRAWPGFHGVNLIKTGEGRYCIIGEWSDMDAMAAARPEMIATLDSFRHLLETLPGDLGVTDPVSGPVVFSRKS
jgi:quinol monooxygenase YgiN